MESYFDEQLVPLFDSAKKHKPQILIGASGAFDTLFSLLQAEMPGKYPVVSGVYSRKIELADHFGISEKIIRSKRKDLGMMKGMDPARIEMIIYACLFINYVIKKLTLTGMIQSEFSLKEG